MDSIINQPALRIKWGRGLRSGSTEKPQRETRKRELLQFVQPRLLLHRHCISFAVHFPVKTVFPCTQHGNTFLCQPELFLLYFRLVRICCQTQLTMLMRRSGQSDWLSVNSFTHVLQMLSMCTRDKMEQKQEVFLIVWQVGSSCYPQEVSWSFPSLGISHNTYGA